MYLLKVALAVEAGHEGPLKMAALATSLGVSAASANEMVRKLEARGLVAYEPYRGVTLTAPGREVAVRVLRTRRLWSCFLVERLGFTPAAADAMACDLEHVTPVEAADRLASYLGDPDLGPLGKPIPHPGRAPERIPVPLTGVPAGGRVEVAAVAAAATAAGFLAASGVEPGTGASIEATGPGGVLIATDRGEVHLDAATAASILVHRTDGLG
jgi:DtxR family Mn-dependent transcriptional regulator